MRQYQRIVGTLFAVIFIGGGVSHLVLGRLRPADYAVFGETALLPWLSDLWTSFVMPGIGWLTIVLGVYEIGCGVGMFWKRTTTIAAWGMIVFLVFITVVGYGWPTASAGEDLLKNRSVTIIMAALLLPLLKARRERSPDVLSGSVS